MSRFALGHLLIRGRDLKRTVSEYEQRGFTVTYRTDPAKAHNALIYLQDGSFLELFDPKPLPLPDAFLSGVLRLIRPLQPRMIGRLLMYLRSSESLTDYALDSVPADQAAEHVQARIEAGAKLGKRLELSKKLQDGGQQTWWIVPPDDEQLPFFMSEYHPAVPCTEAEVTHANRALGLDTLVIDVPNLTEWTAKYAQLLGSDPVAEGDVQQAFTLEKGHRIQLRQAEHYKLAEIRLRTAEEDLILKFPML